MKLHTDCEVVFFVSSSGHCNLSCKYCIINPIAKHQPSLNYEDLQFLFNQFQDKKAFLSFSGVGDFFAGYSSSEFLLSRILDHDVEIALDINGVALNEYSKLDYDKIAKIRFINLTMHYHQIKEKNIYSLWASNAKILHEMNKNALNPDYIISPRLSYEWEEALLFYESNVFATTGTRILLVRDINQSFSQEDEELLKKLSLKFEHIIEDQYQEDFAQVFASNNKVLCPAGNSYFRIWNDGRVQGCPNLNKIAKISDNGNLKERRLNINADYFYCTTPKYCDCNVIESLSKMQYI